MRHSLKSKVVVWYSFLHKNDETKNNSKSKKVYFLFWVNWTYSSRAGVGVLSILAKRLILRVPCQFSKLSVLFFLWDSFLANIWYLGAYSEKRGRGCLFLSFHAWLSCNQSSMSLNSSTEIEMFQKANDCENLESSKENVYEGIYFSNVASLQIY